MIRLAALLCCIGLICAEAPFNHNVHNERVVGGSEAEPHSWKYQVSLQANLYNDGYWYHICGGSILDSIHIMTAAHCIGNMDPSAYRVALGEHDIYEYGGTELFIGVREIIIHPKWDGELGNGNDIAIMRLDDGLYDNGYIEFAPLPYEGETLPDGFTCYISGWGLLYTGGPVPAKLQEAAINVVAHETCSRGDWWGSIALKSMVCAGGDGITSGCQGDSGGPLSCKVKGDDVFRVHGVVSYGPSGNCNQVKAPTVFTRVSYFIDWIYSTVMEGHAERG